MARIAVVLGSTRQDRFGDKPAAWVVKYLSERSGITVDLVDLREHPMPLFDGPPPAYTLRNYPTEDIARFGRRIDAADGFVMLVPEYNHGYSAALKNAMDHTFVEWQRKPVAFVGWGNVGGARAIEQLRLVTIEFEMAPLRHAVHILPDQMRAARASQSMGSSAFEPLQPKLEKLADDSIWWTEALVRARTLVPR
jgi:NAD(P)H-dependent FMN reductase